MSARLTVTRALISATALAAAFIPPAARADDQPFVTLYSTDVDTQGEREFEQWLFWKSGHTGSSYQDFISQSEVEYGITDNFQGSLYLNYEWSRERDGAAPADTQSLVGGQAEFIYRVLNVYFDPVGLAFYLEPSFGPDQRGLETKVLLQKNFLNDTLRFVINTNFEDDWDRFAGRWYKTSALEFDAGLAYNITPDLSAGIEFDNERATDGLVIGGSSRELTSAFYLGPTVQYIAGLTKITFGGEAQLPIAGNTAREAGLVQNGFVSDAERFRLILRVSRDF